MQYKEIADGMIPIMKDAGVLLRSFWGKALTLEEKGGGELVTEADRTVEVQIKNSLHQLMPDAGFCAEESGEAASHNGYSWVIDPLDGTTNFTRTLPYFCTSVALTYQGKPVVGMIYDPLREELFSAITGEGAFLNGMPVRVHEPATFERSLISFGLPYRGNGPYSYEQLMRIVQRAVDATGKMRQMGAIALDLANVAAGRFDGAFFAGLKWWDVAAGILLIKEAGGQATDFQGREVCQSFDSCIAGSQLVHKKLEELVKTVD